MLTISLCTDGEFHILLNTGTTRPLPLSQVITWLSSCPYWTMSLPSFEAVVTAAAVVPDARPTGLECFPALPGILSPLGFSMFAVLYLRLVLPVPQRAVLLSPFRLLDAGPLLPSSQTCKRRARRNEMENRWESSEQAPRKAVPSSLLTSLGESGSFIYSV